MQRTQARHAVARRRSPGPITAAYNIARKCEPKPVAWALRIWPLLPALCLVPAVLHHDRVGHFAGQVLGLDATLCLVACITVTPLMHVMRARAAKLRIWYGLWMFALGAAGTAFALLLDRHHPAQAVAGNSAAWTGLVIVAALVPMTVTSNVLAQKLLGPEWKRWQRWLVWSVWLILVLHLAALHSWTTLVGFTAATVPLIVLRRKRPSIKAWRSGGYSTGGWWLGLAVLVGVWLGGLTVLIVQLAVACAQSASG